jgi:hypothetical protein
MDKSELEAEGQQNMPDLKIRFFHLLMLNCVDQSFGMGKLKTDKGLAIISFRPDQPLYGLISTTVS